MRILCFAAFLCLVGASSTVWGEERVAETLENVDFIIANLRDENGSPYGESYYALNRNNYPMRISMKVTKSENSDAKIVPYTIVMEPNMRIFLGSIVKGGDVNEDALWNYEWEVEPDLQHLNVEKLEMCSKQL